MRFALRPPLVEHARSLSDAVRTTIDGGAHKDRERLGSRKRRIYRPLLSDRVPFGGVLDVSEQRVSESQIGCTRTMHADVLQLGLVTLLVVAEHVDCLLELALPHQRPAEVVPGER